MCQLFGFSAAAPLKLTFGWRTFALRGSPDAGNPDGWGVAYFTGGDVALVREPMPAARSPLVRFLGRHAPSSALVISHVRRAVGSPIRLANTHPFVRTLGGASHVFAHNGHAPMQAPRSAWLAPLGDTDSERMFLVLLDALEPLWRAGRVPPLGERLRVIERFAGGARRRGAANFLYGDGDTLFAHGHRRTLPGEEVSADPGLYYRERVTGDGCQCTGVSINGDCPAIAEIATVPLDDGSWRPLRSGEIACFQLGRRVHPVE